MLSFFRKLLSARKTEYLLPKEVTVHGNIESAISGYIDGIVEGDIKTESNLVVSKNAIIQGDIYATNLLVYGKIYGNIFCSNKTAFANASYVKGNVTAAIFDIKEGAVIEGIIKKNTEIESTALIDESAKNFDPESAGYKVKSSVDNDSYKSNWF